MSFRLRRGESAEAAIQRIAREQIDKGLGELRDPQLGPHETVHQVRKRCKKLRGLLRLVRPEFEGDETYARENAWYRDSARGISRARDAQSVLECLDGLSDDFGGELDHDAFAAVRVPLLEHRERVVAEEIDLDRRLHAVGERLEEGRERVAGWRLAAEEFEAVRRGLEKTYGRARKAREAAYDRPGTERFHQWRKRVKYHGYHLRLLRPIWKHPLRARRDEVDELSELLGDDHDLSVLRATLLEERADRTDEGARRAVLGVALQRQIELRSAAWALGARLFAEPPKPFARRLGAYWAAWRQAPGPGVVHEPGLTDD